MKRNFLCCLSKAKEFLNAKATEYTNINRMFVLSTPLFGFPTLGNFGKHLRNLNFFFDIFKIKFFFRNGCQKHIFTNFLLFYSFYKGVDDNRRLFTICVKKSECFIFLNTWVFET